MGKVRREFRLCFIHLFFSDTGPFFTIIKSHKEVVLINVISNNCYSIEGRTCFTIWRHIISPHIKIENFLQTQRQVSSIFATLFYRITFSLSLQFRFRVFGNFFRQLTYGGREKDNSNVVFHQTL